MNAAPVNLVFSSLKSIAPAPNLRGSENGLVSLESHPLHVAIVDEELPYPPTSGKRIRTLNLILRLARRHRITYLCHRNADAKEARRAAAFFQARGIETISVDRVVPPKSGPGFYARLAANLFSPLPYSVASHNSPALREAISAFAATNAVDLWQCEWTPYAEALRVVGRGRKLVMAHNVESLIWQRYHETTTNKLKRWYIARQWWRFQRFERQAFARATRIVAVSAADAALIRGHFGGERVDVVDNGVDTSYFRPTNVARDPKQILFLGSLDWRPNLDAVAVLLEQVFPAVLAKEPSARLCLVGRNPPARLRQQVVARRGVELHANVDDVRPFITRSGALAVPLRIGGGSRLKILEALACELPVVSTRVGAEGLDLETGKHLTVVEGIESMAAALVGCIRTPGPAQDMARCGRQRVLQQYDWDILAAKLEQVWFRCIKRIHP
jgi:glycosyltransferase involved in cell wall biosynthesis